MKPDTEGMTRLGINKDTEIGLIISEPGFEPYERDDGLHPNNQIKKSKKTLSYNEWLNKLDTKEKIRGTVGQILQKVRTEKFLVDGNYEIQIKQQEFPEKHSETAFMTNRAMEFIKESSDKPWFLHLSFIIKPHWPYMAPAPYHNMFSQNQFYPVHRSEIQKENTHPVYQAFMDTTFQKLFLKTKLEIQFSQVIWV